MKKIIALVLSLIMIVGLCSLASAEDWKFERKIEIVCPWGLGGGADGAIRPMALLLTKILGVPVEVNNVTGAGGVNGLEYTYKQPADGYTFMVGTQSLIIQDLSGYTSMDFKDELIPVDMLMHSINMLYASKVSMERYGVSNWTELTQYVAAHPYEVSVGMMTATGVDGMCLEIATGDLALNIVTYSDGSEVNSDLAGGHVDLAVGGYDDVSGLIESGDVMPILVFCEHRLSIFPECECTADVGIDSYAGPWRAIFAKKGTPQGAIDALVAAVEEARLDPTWQQFLHDAAYDEREIHAAGEDLRNFELAEYKDLRDYYLEQDLLEKDYDDLK
ncbi:MAG: tripartite tricarboxylate transporter substrate binding protein [Clostridia bacterium]|nr:tripartite tricarboxylate transporter substrate binding protein [Clostridia bacterium]